jgi:hypothetical protein
MKPYPRHNIVEEKRERGEVEEDELRYEEKNTLFLILSVHTLCTSLEVHFKRRPSLREYKREV